MGPQAQQLANGDLIMFDNGNARVEGGYAGGGAQSRAVSYSLDLGARTATLNWQLPVTYDSHQGR